jgi:uncharacterized protein
MSETSLDYHEPALRLQLFPSSLFIHRLPPGSSQLPKLTAQLLSLPPSPSNFYTITSTFEETSIVAPFLISSTNEEALSYEGPYRFFRIKGPLPFHLTGILATLLKPLKEKEISVFAISSFDTDWVLIKEEKMSSAKSVLELQGWQFENVQD